MQPNCTSTQLPSQNKYLYTVTTATGKYSLLETPAGDIRIIGLGGNLLPRNHRDAEAAERYIQHIENRPPPLCHYCDKPMSPGHVTDPCGLPFCNTDCLANFEETIPRQPTQLSLFPDLPSVPAIPSCHYCGTPIDSPSPARGLRFCDEVCQGYWDVRQTWQVDVSEFLNDHGGNEQTNVFEGAL